MGDSHNSLPPAEAEAFWTGGEDARNGEDARQDTPGGDPETFQNQSAAVLKKRRESCCAGVDVPGVGHVHSVGCPRKSSPVRSGRECAAGDFPQNLRVFLDGDSLQVQISAEDREDLRRFVAADGEGARLQIKLLFAARSLAHSRVVPSDGQAPPFCAECVSVWANGVVVHERLCHVGTVLNTLDEFFAFYLNKKEAAGGEETGRTGAGVRPCAGPGDGARGLAADEPADRDLRCTNCGERGGDWIQIRKFDGGSRFGVWLSLTQRTCADGDGNGMYVCEHRCGTSRLSKNCGAE